MVAASSQITAMPRGMAILAVLAGALAQFAAPGLQAQDLMLLGDGKVRSVTVMGEGTAQAPPTQATLLGVLLSNGDDGAKAFETHLQARTKVEKEFANGAFKVSVAFGGERLAGASILAEEPIEAAVEDVESNGVALLEVVTLSIGIASDMERAQAGQKLAQVLDRARKAGVRFQFAEHAYMSSGESLSTATFKVDDPEKLAKRAVEAAVEDARAKAGRLAALAGGKVGRVLTISEADYNPYAEYYEVETDADYLPGGQNEEGAATANRPIVVRRRVKIAFELTD